MKQTTIQNTLQSWLTLHLAPRFSSSNWQHLLANQFTPDQLCQLDAKQLSMLGLKPETVNAILQPNQRQIEQILSWLQTKEHHLLTLTDPRYPPLLASIPDPPPLIYIKGNPAILTTPQLAIVGSRNPTHNGLATATQFAKQLTLSGLTVTSGLATGIDSAAHLGALETSSLTIAVLGCGLSCIYPTINRDLAAKISENGAIVSEFTPTTPPKPYHFPRRNRIISGLSLGTLVVEANKQSGSLITARLAGEQGREVFAIPGSILNPAARGCLALIQQGAKLTTCINDILEELNFAPNDYENRTERPLAKAKLDPNELKLLECIGYDITHFEQLVDRTGFPPQKVSAMLCNLKLNGYIREEMGGYSQVLL